MTLDKLRVLMLNLDANSRGRLRESVTAVAYKSEIRQVRSRAEILDALTHDGPFQVLFISHSLGAEEIRQILLELKQANLLGKQKLIVTVDSVLGGVGSAVVELYLAGVDGFIAEPYSANEIRRLLETVQDPSKTLGADAAGVRVRRAVELLASEAVPHIDQIYEMAFQGLRERGGAMVELRRIKESFETLVQQAPSEFADALSSVFEAAETPHRTPRRSGNRVQTRAPHPGEVVEELMKLRGLTKERILSLVRMDPGQFDQLLAKQISIDETMSRELARVLGKASREWLAIQKKYDNAQPKTNPGSGG